MDADSHHHRNRDFCLGRGDIRQLQDCAEDTLDIYLIGKQWMWKLQQPNGRKEINELHVPVNRNIKLIMGSEDVIHDFMCRLSA